MSYDYRERRGGGCMTLLGNLLLMIVGGLLLVALIAMFGIWQTGDRFFEGIDRLFTAPQPTPQVDIRSVVVRQIRDVSELTTTIYAMETVADASRARTLLGVEVGETKLLYIAYGEVRAGVDLGALENEDVEVLSDTIRIRLPPPRILDSKIDVNRSRIYDYDKGFLSLGPDAPELQSVAEQQALSQIITAACEHDVLQMANDKAEVAITRLLGLSGFRDVEVITQAPPAGACATP